MKDFITKHLKKVVILSVLAIMTFATLFFVSIKISASPSYEGMPIKASTPMAGVYLVEGGHKRSFPSELVFFSHNYKWSDVVTVSSTEVADIPEGLVMPYNVHYRDGKPIKASTPMAGIYLVINGVKRVFPSELVFYSHNYKWSDVVTISPEELDLIPEDSVIPYNVHYRDGNTIKASAPMAGVYLVENGIKRAFPNAELFLSRGYKWSDIITVSTTELGLIPDGLAIGQTNQLTITDPTITATKSYDGDADAAVAAGAMSGVVEGDDVIVNAVATYDNSSVGTGKTITVVYTLSGADAAKYVKPVDYHIHTGIITANIINISAISGVTAPATGATPVTTTTNTDQYTGSVSWVPVDSPFAQTTAYTAWITLTPKTGYTCTGVEANSLR